ncbi:MAG: glucose-1-phosphate adenylyltransferase [Firmicutes bacterium]|nr:glucose-1-phosphate adenylyltransferase [Bacillota bacterium]
MKKKKCIAMLLAGGQGSRLGSLTKNIAKPAVSFGGKYRIIDFSLSNCANSHIDTVGVLTQYRPMMLNAYIGNGASWDLDSPDGGVFILPPYETEKGGNWYKGTADAIYRNIDFIKANDPEYILILSGDHIYNMDYRSMLASHISHRAELTISVMPVPMEEASRFGIITTDETKKIVKFSEKPKKPDSNLASMGIYIFTTDVLIDALERDAENPDSKHDFGMNVIPMLLGEGKRLFAHKFEGYWKDVGTIQSYYDANMELLDDEDTAGIYKYEKYIMTNNVQSPAKYIGEAAEITNSLISNGSMVLGKVDHSILSTGCYVGKGAEVVDSLLLPGAKVMEGAKVHRTIMGERSVIEAGTAYGQTGKNAEIMTIGDNCKVDAAKEAR